RFWGSENLTESADGFSCADFVSSRSVPPIAPFQASPDLSEREATPEMAECGGTLDREMEIPAGNALRIPEDPNEATHRDRGEPSFRVRPLSQSELPSFRVIFLLLVAEPHRRRCRADRSQDAHRGVERLRRGLEAPLHRGDACFGIDVERRNVVTRQREQ